MYKHKKASKGFTLVELLVVIAIIGVLATLVLLQLGTARAKARDTKRIADINQLRSAIELYFDDNNNQYPGGALASNPVSDVNLGKYMATPHLPSDPVTGTAGAAITNYFYVWAPSGAGAKAIQYHLYAELEQKNTAALNGDSDINSTTAATATSAGYFFTGPIGVQGAPATGFDGSNNAVNELCTANYAAGAARDCIFDTGQK